ncbi:MAG: serine hydrolase domain-containing protein [Parasphingorhabdus sp.]
MDQGWFRNPITSSASAEDFITATEKRIKQEQVGNLGVLLIEDGQIAGSYYASVGEPVGPDSVFQVASLSKWVTAWGVMAMVEDGKLDLDKPVSRYLTRWQLPESEFSNEAVTTRLLLSHTAGLGDGLGYAGFDKKEDVQTLEASLTRAKDASPGKDGFTSVAHKPGEKWDYSGGGFTLLQLMVEEVSGQSFNEYMKERIFEPLGMNRSTFDYDEAVLLGLAENYNQHGSIEALKRYTSLAAASLHTSPADMAKFVQAQADPNIATKILSIKAQKEMRLPHGEQLGSDIWGLGTMLYASNNQNDYIIGHDGNNDPAINTAVRMDPATGNGIVVLETGNALLATQVAGEWVFWKTGNVDFLDFTLTMENMFLLILIGALVIFLVGLMMAWRTFKRRQTSLASAS